MKYKPLRIYAKELSRSCDKFLNTHRSTVYSGFDNINARKKKNAQAKKILATA